MFLILNKKSKETPEPSHFAGTGISSLRSYFTAPSEGFSVCSKGYYKYGGIDDLGLFGPNGKRVSYSDHSHSYQWCVQNGTIRCGIASDSSAFRTYDTSGNAKDDVMTCGSGSVRWKRFYAANSSISTSDRRLKTNVSTYSEQYEKLFDQLNPVTYSWKNNIGNNDNHDRTHTGFIAQEVKEAMDSVGLTDKDFAAFCYDDFTKDPEWNPETTNGMTDRYSLAYEEFISLNTHMIQKTRNDMFTIASTVNLHQVQLDELEHEIYKLKNELSQLKQAQ